MACGPRVLAASLSFLPQLARWHRKPPPRGFLIFASKSPGASAHAGRDQRQHHDNDVVLLTTILIIHVIPETPTMVAVILIMLLLRMMPGRLRRS
jgi:hypothetical protein